MFYITEIYFRIVYLILLIFCLFVLYYEYKETTLIIFLVPSKIFGYNCIEHFIYTHPTELLFALLNLNFFLIVICLIPYLMWLIVDFLRTGLFLNEYQKIKIYSKIFSLLIVLLNIILFVFFFPIIFNFFESFNYFESQSINIKFELKILEFVSFLYNIFCIINISLFFTLILFFIIVLNGIDFYIKHKNFFFIFNILSATFLSPPDVNSQLSLFIIFSIILEIFQFINLYRIKIINMATY